MSDYWFSSATCDIKDLVALCEQPTLIEDYPHAHTIEKNTVVYDSNSLHEAIATPEGRLSVMAELADALRVGPGIVVFKHAFDSEAVLPVSGGHKTGMYLDQQSNYESVARWAKDAAVLDCFSFLGGFSLHAARAGARTVVGVDQSAEA